MSCGAVKSAWAREALLPPPHRAWAGCGCPTANSFGLPSLLLHSLLSGPQWHALCPPRCLERSFQECPHLTSAPSSFEPGSVEQNSAQEPEQSFGRAKPPNRKAAPHSFPLPRHGSCLGFRCPRGTALCTSDRAGLHALQCLGCTSPRLLPWQLCCPGCPALHFLLLFLLLPPLVSTLHSRALQPWQGTLPQTRRCMGHQEQGCSRHAIAKPWQRPALGIGLKLLCPAVAFPCSTKAHPPLSAYFTATKTHSVRHSGLRIGPS